MKNEGMAHSTRKLARIIVLCDNDKGLGIVDAEAPGAINKGSSSPPMYQCATTCEATTAHAATTQSLPGAPQTEMVQSYRPPPPAGDHAERRPRGLMYAIRCHSVAQREV